MSGTSRRKGSKGGRSGSRAGAPPVSSALAWAESLAAQAAQEAPAEAPPSPWGGADADDGATPFGPTGAASPFGAAGGDEWVDTRTLGVGISPEIAARARRSAASSSPFGTTSDERSPFGFVGSGTTSDEPTPFGGFAGSGTTSADPAETGSPAPSRAGGKKAKAPKRKGGRKGRPGRTAVADPATIDEAGPFEGDALPDVPPGEEAGVDDGSPAAIPPKRRRVRPGEVKAGDKPPSIAPGKGGRKGRGTAPAGRPRGLKALTRRLGVPRLLDKPLVLVLAALVALGGGLGAGWVLDQAGGAEELPAASPQACATAQLSWAQSNNAQASMNGEDPATLRNGFIQSRNALDGVNPPAAVAEDWGTVVGFVTAAAGAVEGIDPADSEGVVAALNSVGPSLDQQEMIAASKRISTYLESGCTG
ncbi:hypothetical protein L1785_01065 [Antribacter sp. KLBMP9083]|uniref:Uncharacterized protein n=1 Tax=Antribacter soli TaxID=2910976 RepID=A0AA41U7P0_9MICO|nr:hypothetical protein [Antribacter soli]MCF4119567.1 hypothetical protein [Antribacter soli]